MADRTAHDTAKHIPAPLFVEVDPLCEQETDRTDMVGDDTVACGVGGIIVVRFTYQLADGIQKRCEEAGVVVVEFALFDRDHTLEPHPRIDARFGQRMKLSLLISFVLHEDKVPDLEESVTLATHHILRRVEVLLSLIVEDLATRTARTGITHLPEVVLIPKTHDALFGDMRFPHLVGFIVTIVYGHPDLLDRQRQILLACDELPRIGDRLFLEVVSKTEVPQHLEEGMVARGVPYIIKVVVLPPCPDTGLRRGRSGRIGHRCLTGKDVLELHHPRIGEKKGRIIRNQRRTLHQLMSFALKIV